jgi:CheY-like chemotaxis protein
MRIVVADDDQAVRSLMVFHLKCEGFDAVEAAAGCAALRQVREVAELVILDLGLPVIDGLGVMRALRGENRAVPVLVLSGRTDEIDRVVTFELGADDFVVKPFFPREVVCRVRAILRRKTVDGEASTRVLRYGRLELDEGGARWRGSTASTRGFGPKSSRCCGRSRATPASCCRAKRCCRKFGASTSTATIVRSTDTFDAFAPRLKSRCIFHPA